MTQEEFNIEFENLKYEWQRLRRRFNNLSDKIEWYELAEELLVKGETTDPLIALLTVERTNPSNYNRSRELTAMQERASK